MAFGSAASHFFRVEVVVFLVVEAVGFGAVENTLGAVDFVLLTVEAVVVGAVENLLPVVEFVLLTVEAVVFGAVENLLPVVEFVLLTAGDVVLLSDADVMNSGSSSKKG